MDSEAGVIASLVYHPEFSFYSENLLPNHFFNKENRYIYAAICNLAQRGVQHIDPYSVFGKLKVQKKGSKSA
ncbi:DnaB-like helicase N-terminal domain-containing protein [Neglectibacter timonensis]|uniref:DnaB-like helicase N-terminal domain-containing protein n=1 Tax=Neglectibacter timonensis TaxID=1776382 RepID=UPI0039918048